MKEFFNKTHCDRCGSPLAARTMSKFNRDTICLNCKTDERDAPGFAQADAAEVAAVRSGQKDYPGVGLSEEDRKFLAQRLVARKTDAAPSLRGAYCTVCGAFSMTPYGGGYVEVGEWDGKSHQVEGQAEGWECQSCDHIFLAFTFGKEDLPDSDADQNEGTDGN